MTVFENCTVVFDVKNVPFKEKQKLKSALLENGGNISYTINKECSFVVTSSVNDLSSNRQRSIQKLQIPVVGTQYVWSCVDEGHLLPLTEHNLTPQLSYPTNESLPSPGVIVSTKILEKNKFKGQPDLPNAEVEILEKGGPRASKFRVYKGADHDLPEFPSFFQVAKYSVFEKVKPKTLSVLELQSVNGRAGQQYRVLCSVLREAETAVLQDKLVFCETSEDAVEAYLMLMKDMETQGFTKTHTLPAEVEHLASYSLQQLLLEERLNCSTLSKEVGVFVELIWTEALGSLNNILTVPVSRISLNDVSRVEGLLLQAQKTQNEDEAKALLEEVNTLLPLRIIDPPSKHKLVSQKLDLCQLIRDIVNVSEATLGSPSPSSLGKYRALRCSIDFVPPENPEFHAVSKLLQDRPVQIQQIVRISRGVELQMFREELGNIKPLLHSTSPSSLVGILSRGLLLPRVGVELHGIERTDIGNLGGGIYFSDSLKTSVKYSKPSVTDGSRLLLVCEVALGRCKDLLKKDTSLTCAPDGFHSVHGVRRSHNRLSEFEDDEFVVFNTEQIRLKYVVQFTVEGDELKDFQPQISTLLELTDTPTDVLSSDDSEGLESTKNPLEEMNAGLLDSSGQKLPLQAVNVKCKLMDLMGEVIIFQTYTNQSAVPIEAKFVFPLEETAAVCGFEAFINGKHVIGKVKEKEQARKEYKQAIEKGHGAYLMDQDAPDVFTISVGNLPPGASVLIKVTFITELVVRSGSIVFSLSGSVAPWQESAALNQTTQTTVEKIGLSESKGEFSLSMSIEMPYEIINLNCSHRIKTKMTDCKAVISTVPGQTLGPDGLQVSFSLSNIHMPRMWVENHPEKDSQACMLVFYPDFKSSGLSLSGGSSSVSDVVILLDSSRSMQGEAMLNARRIALQVLKSLARSLKINIISFSTDYKEAFPAPVPLNEASEAARKFIMSCSGAGGSTDLWRPLRSLSLLPPCQGMRNVLLLSDGHVQNQPVTLQLVRENSCHTRLFTCGLSLTANRHMLRALAQAGGGTYEFFDTKMKHTWAEKVRAQVQRMESPGCRSVAVKWQQFNPRAPPPVQAPSQLHSLFSDWHTLVYGFVPHCTQATLFGDLSGQEIKTMVSTTELQKTKGTFLHKLTARAIIRNYEDGILGNSEAEHEEKKAELKSFIIELSKEFSILSQFTSFVAIEEREANEFDTGFTDIPKLISEEDVDILPYMGWTEAAAEDDELMELVEASDYLCAKYSLEDSHFFSTSSDVGFALQEATPDYLCYNSEEESFDDLVVPPSPSVPVRDLRLRAFPRYAGSAGFLGRSLSNVCSITSGPPPPSHPPPSCPRLCDVLIEGSNLQASEIWEKSLDSFSMTNRPPPPAPPPAGAPGAAPRIQSMRQHAMPRLEQFLSMTPSRPLPPPPPLFQAVKMSGGDFMRDSCPPPPANQIAAAGHSPPFANSMPVMYTSSESAISFSADAITSGHRARPLSEDYFLPSPLTFAQCMSVTPDIAPPPPPPPPVFTPPTSSEHGYFSRSECSTFAFGQTAESIPQGSVFGGFGGSLQSAQSGSSTSGLFGSSLLRQQDQAIQNLQLLQQTDTLTPAQPELTHTLEDSPVVKLSMIKMKKKSKGFHPWEQMKTRKMILDQPVMTEELSRPDTAVPWNELFELQHEDGYWECTGRMSRFFNLDVDFFANIFLKEKGIQSLGVKAHADILRLLATLLVLQLIRVKKLEVGRLLESLLRLKESQEPRLMYWEAVKRAVDWACQTDRQYPCVCSRLEIGRDWESSTRQLLGCDSPHPYSPLKPVLERRMDV
ncbi:protein mono-ADP-ribosyltransferase PARP4 [Danio rerio]|uniref:Poly [ADP-ribose] polymerase n=1 Tax=Danio rerio TaxID=7955 RepID=A0A8M6Z886_DANRE